MRITGPRTRSPGTSSAPQLSATQHDFDVNVLALRTLAELLGDVHDPDAQRDLRRRINDLLGRDPDRAEPVSRPE